MTDSPLRRLRETCNLTIDRVAQDTGLSKQFIIKSEQCVYSEPSDTLIRFYESKLEDNVIDDVYTDYYKFQREVRKFNYGQLIEPWVFIGYDEHPFRNWRVCSGVGSLSGLCRIFCVHPAVMTKFESTPWQLKAVPEQLVKALLESGYRPTTIQALEEAYYEYRRHLRGELEYVSD